MGKYPPTKKTKKRVKVADVAMWQNNGTERIKPARFIEKAMGKHRRWRGIISRSTRLYLFGSRRNNGNFELSYARTGRKIADDINRAVNRIDTGRLRESMRPIYLIDDSEGRGRYYSK